VSWAFGWYVAVLENNNFTLKALFFPPDFGEGIDLYNDAKSSTHTNLSHPSTCTLQPHSY
jgi:hypothetical protein